MYNRVFVSEGDTVVSMGNDTEKDPTYKEMPDINSDKSPLDSMSVKTVKSENNRSKESNRNEIEEQDRIALEENCKLRDLPYDTCLQNELPEEPIRYFQLLQEKVTSQYHFLQTHYLKSWQIQTNFHMEMVASQILREIQN